MNIVGRHQFAREGGEMRCRFSTIIEKDMRQIASSVTFSKGQARRYQREYALIRNRPKHEV
ncbi:hypothetical protein DUT91_09630 [Phyllobacterium salinisoli]|uniref:Uncharacterized protein n=1 Tax=Phyllobacterium salinisoli TaxID=1899321 RepID=A0A368K5P0_9HYPH|nr:hypothetical protein [Phyllobacterium salinisoli]RCS24514.1 hypothetical protein DUT91_09630 [Phyllobacterium salinisoli]